MGTGTSTGNFQFFQVVSEPVSVKFGTEKSLGTGIGKMWYRKKVSGPVSGKVGTGKSLGTGIGKIWYRKKSRNRYRKNLVPELIFVAKILEFRRFLMGTGTGTGNF